jgi:L-rhamnonate dehydratase
VQSKDEPVRSGKLIGQMHNYHLTVSCLNHPISECFPIHDVEIGNELFHSIFDGDPTAENGFIQLDGHKPGFEPRMKREYLDHCNIIE